MDIRTDIIREIYSSVLEPVPWHTALSMLQRQIGANSFHCFTTFIPVDEGGVSITENMPLDVVAAYLKEVTTVDVWFHELLRRHPTLPTGLTYRSAALVQDSAVRRTRFHSDYLVPSDIGSNIGLLIGAGETVETPVTSLSMYTPIGKPPFGASAENELKLFAPHFTQAMRMRQRLGSQAHGFGLHAIEACATAVVMVSANRRVLAANQAAEALFRRRPGCQQLGRLTASTPAAVAALERALVTCASLRLEQPAPMVVRLLGQAGSGVVARLAPLPTSAPRGQRGALAFISEEGSPQIDLVRLATVAYGLTAAETYLVRALIAGKTPEDVSEERSVSLATVKTQLRSVFTKTGTRRQSDLLRVLFSIAR